MNANDPPKRAAALARLVGKPAPLSLPSLLVQTVVAVAVGMVMVVRGVAVRAGITSQVDRDLRSATGAGIREWMTEAPKARVDIHDRIVVNVCHQRFPLSEWLIGLPDLTPADGRCQPVSYHRGGPG